MDDENDNNGITQKLAMFLQSCRVSLSSIGWLKEPQEQRSR